MSFTAMAESWPLEQLIKLHRSQPSLGRRALQRLLDEDEQLRWSVVVSAYLDEEVSLARAASLLGLHPLELRERFIDKGIPLRLGPVDKADAQAEVDAIRAWKSKPERLVHKVQ
jgi:predicted HTH domain antitoxin